MGGQARLTIMWTVPGPRLRLALRIAAVWSLLWPLFGLLFLMVVLEQVPLGSRFNVFLASALFASVLSTLLLAMWLVWSPSRRRGNSVEQSRSAYNRREHASRGLYPSRSSSR